MILGPAVVEDKLSDAQREETDTSNSNMDNCVTGFYTQVYGVAEVVIDKGIDREK